MSNATFGHAQENQVGGAVVQATSSEIWDVGIIYADNAGNCVMGQTLSTAVASTGSFRRDITFVPNAVIICTSPNGDDKSLWYNAGVTSSPWFKAFVTA